MSSVTKLGYVGIEADDLGAWKKFGTDVMGLQVGRDSSDSQLYLRSDERHHRMTVHPGGSNDISYIGWEVANHEALEAAAASLERHGVKVTAATPTQCADRRALEMVYFTCPHTGVRMELSFGNEVVFNPPYRPSRELSGFKTGDLGMGHLVLYTTDPEKTADFYVKALGFGVSDWVVSPEGKRLAVFLHCNPRHHSIAFIFWPTMPRKIQHVFLETNTLDDIGRSYDLCKQLELAKTTIGRHPNDRSVSFYFKNPSRWFIEYGWDLRVVDPQTNTVEQYVLRPGISWGHAGLRELES